MQTGLEKLRLCWELWGATGREKWRFRRQLSVATFWWWLSEWHVRLCLARYCVSIYRRELAHHREESALMRLAFWQDKCAEESGSDWESPDYPAASTPSETCVSGGVLGIPWRIWGRLSVIGWLLLIPASWASVFLAWGGIELLRYGAFFLWLGLAAGWNGIPGAAALLNPQVRGRLLLMPEAAALSSLTLSAAVGLAGGFMATCLHLEMPVSIALSGIIFGILFFPLSFGLIFPLAIPLVCCFTIWATAKRYDRISQVSYAVLSGASAAGWLGVALIGPVVGLGGS